MAHIIRRADVQLEDPYVLDLTKVHSGEGSPVDAMDRIRVVESDPQYTLLEVTCGCGQKTYMRCDH